MDFVIAENDREGKRAKKVGAKQRKRKQPSPCSESLSFSLALSFKGS